MRHPLPLRLLLFLDTDQFGGPARLAVDFAVQARQLGHDVLILGLVRGGGPDSTDFARAVEAAGIPLRLLRERFRFDPGVIGQFKKVLEEYRPDIYQSHGYKGSLLGLAARRRGIPWQAVFHGPTWENWKVRLYHALETRWLRRADEVIVVARRFASALAAKGVRPERLRWIPNAIAEPALRASASGADLRREWSGGAADEVIVGTIGRFSPEKGPDRFLRVFARAARRRPGLRAVMVGAGPELAACRRQAAALGCAPDVIFAGWRTDLASVYAALDMLVIASRSEGMPTVMLEAMLLGVPVVSTAVGAVPDVARDGATALVVAEEDEAALEEAILRLAADPALGRQLAEAARAMARERLTVEARTATLLEHARRLCEAAALPDDSWGSTP